MIDRGWVCAWAQALGHRITNFGPSLCSFLTIDSWMYTCSGVSLPSACICRGGKKWNGPVLFTHFGLSGPLAFIVASWVAWEEITIDRPLRLTLAVNDWTYDEIDRWLCEQHKVCPHRHVATVLRTLMPVSLVRQGNLLLDGLFDRVLASLTKAERGRIARFLSQGVQCTIVGRRPGDEFVTAGGVATDDVDPYTMRSRCCPGLFCAGEILNIDGYTGGYNLQVAWSTATFASQGIIRYCTQ